MMNLTRVKGRKAENMVNTYNRTPDTQKTLYDIYKTVSHNKVKAYNDCLILCRELNGHDYKVCSGNTFNFTFAFRYTDTTGKEMLCYMTASNTYSMEYNN